MKDPLTSNVSRLRSSDPSRRACLHGPRPSLHARTPVDTKSVEVRIRSAAEEATLLAKISVHEISMNTYFSVNYAKPYVPGISKNISFSIVSCFVSVVLGGD